MLDINSVGKTPAAHYLIRRLNEINDPYLTRACLTRINALSAQVKDITESNLQPKTVANIARLMRDEITKLELEDGLPDSKFVSQLVRNVMIGKVKQLMRKASVQRKCERVVKLSDEVYLKRVKVVEDDPEIGPYHTVAGQLVAYDDCFDYREVPNRLYIEDTITPELLHARSDKRCKRQGKPHMQK